jgi:hypothetical protein
MARKVGEMDGEEQDGPPALLVEWQEALQAYVDAKEAGQLTEAIRQRALRAWAPLRDTPAFEPSPFALKLMKKIERRPQLTAVSLKGLQ